jgi:cell wall-associated NlpC family hydrolase
MKPLMWTLCGALVLLLTIPLGLVLFVTTVATPAVAADTCIPPAVASGSPQPGNPRQASLGNPPTEIPAPIQVLYEAAATRYGLPWTLLAGVGMEETDHGRNNTTSSAGAQGLMQFMPATFATYGVDGNGDGRASITDDADSVHSAANYLVASGALSGPEGVRKALFAYNHALWYVNDVLYYAAAYSGGDLAENPCVTEGTETTGTPLTGTGPATDAVNAALGWIGTRYSWGGGTPSGPSTGICCSPHGQDGRLVNGFDCSGLVLYAYAQIGVRLPHLAHDITYHSGGQVIPRDFTLMKLGDVIGFSNTPGGRVFHVGIYLGEGRMVNSDGSGVSIDSLTTGYYSRLAWRVVRFVGA